METKTVWAISIVVIAILAFASLTYYYSSYLYSPVLGQPQQPTDQADLNWAGYSVATSFSDPKPVVTEVSGSWIVPEVSLSENDTFSAVWIGIGGFFGHSLIQTGTEQDCLDGAVYYSAWFELLPADAVTIATMDVSPGDIITASISLSIPAKNMWVVYISDLSSGQEFRQDFFYDSSQLSAEWIVERPDVNDGLSAIADFGTVELSNCTATIEDKVAATGDFPSVRLSMHDLEGIQLAKASDLNSDRSSFSVKYATQ